MPLVLLVFVVAYLAVILERTRITEFLGAAVWSAVIFTGPLLLVVWALWTILSR